MPNSLIDFSKYVGIMQNQAQLQMRKKEQELQARQTLVNERQIALNESAATQQQIKNLHEIYKDPRFQFNAPLRNQLMGTIATLAGAPTIGLNAIQARNEEMDNLMRGLASNDRDAVQNAYAGLAITMTPEQFSEFSKNMEATDKLREQNRSIAQLREMNADKFQKIQDATARVNMGRPMATVASVEFGRLLNGTDGKGFGAMMDSFEVKPEVGAALLSSSNPLAREAKKRIPHLLDGNTAKQASDYAEMAARHEQDAQHAQDALTQWEEKQIPLPKGVSPAMMRSKIEMATTVGDAYRSMSEWLTSPFDKTKYAAAKSAARNVEQFRLSLNDLDRKTQTDSAQLKQAAMALSNDKFDYKQEQDNAVALGQQEYFALPDKQRNGQAAARIAAKVMTDTGVPVKVSDITKDPTAPTSVVKVDMTQEKEEAKKVGGGFGEQYTTLLKADVDSRSKMAKYDRMDQLLQGIETGRLEPAKTSIQAMAESMGFSVDKSLPAKQAFTALAGEIALSLRNPSGGAGMPGALSDRDLTFLQSMTPDLAKTTEGNRMIIDTARKLGKRDQDIAKMARDYRRKHGQFDEGFFDELAAYSEKNPLFTEKPSKAKPSQPSPSQQQGGAVLKTLPQGSKQIGTSGGKPVYQDATGKKWIGE